MPTGRRRVPFARRTGHIATPTRQQLLSETIAVSGGARGIPRRALRSMLQDFRPSVQSERADLR